MSEFKTVCKEGEIAEGQGRAFNLNGRTIAVFFHEGEYYAINDFCPHQGASLALGGIYKDAVTCPLHAWRFSLHDGKWVDNPKVSVETYATRVVDGEVQVSVPETPPKFPWDKK